MKDKVLLIQITWFLIGVNQLCLTRGPHAIQSKALCDPV